MRAYEIFNYAYLTEGYLDTHSVYGKILILYKYSKLRRIIIGEKNGKNRSIG